MCVLIRIMTAAFFFDMTRILSVSSSSAEPCCHNGTASPGVELALITDTTATTNHSATVVNEAEVGGRTGKLFCVL